MLDRISKDKIFGRITLVLASSAIAATLSLSNPWAPAATAIAPDAMAQVIYKAKILAPGTQLRVHIKGDHASISSFRNERANDKDCKIEALVVGKTVFETAPDITSVTYYFFNNRAPNEYKAATIRTTDVKAFEGGAVNQDTLLSSIELKAGTVQDASTALESRMMLMAAARRDVQIVDKGEDLEISCKMPPLSEAEYKFEAFKMAQTALHFGGTTSAKRVRVLFFNPMNPGTYKQVSISVANLTNVEKQVADAFHSLDLSEGRAKLSAKDIEPSDGPHLAERTTLLEKIQGLEDKGVGVDPFVLAYQNIDSLAGAGDDTKLVAAIQRLSDSVAEQEKRYESAQSFKPTKDKSGADDNDKGPKRIGRDVKTPNVPGLNRYVLGFFPMPPQDILRDPDGYMNDCKERFQKELKGKPAEQDIRYSKALLWVAAVLKVNDRAPEAKKFEDQARTLAARVNAK